MIGLKKINRIIMNKAYFPKLSTFKRQINIKLKFIRNYINIGKIKSEMKKLNNDINKDTIHYLPFQRK